MDKYLPQGVLGVAITGLVAAFMAGMAANVSSFNAVFTYDLWQDYIRPGRPDRYYLAVGRWATVGGVVIGIGTAFFAAVVQQHLQLLPGAVLVPQRAAVRRVHHRHVLQTDPGPSAGFWGILVGTLTSVAMYILYKAGAISIFRSDLHESLWGGIVAFSAGAIAILVASRGQTPKADAELHGLVYGMAIEDPSTATYGWYRNPVVMGSIAIILGLLLYIVIALL